MNYGAEELTEEMTLAIIEDGADDPSEQEVSRAYLDMNPFYPNFTVIDRNHVVQGNGLNAAAAIELVD